ncbi:MAG TPA: hypothetical protein VH475_20950 [Tepidisphaeraceae bacterium]
MAWFRPEDWNRLLEISVDRDRLERSHAEWVRSANRVMRRLERQGLRPRRVIVDLDELIAWCGQRGLPIDGGARADFASEKLAREEETSKSD